MTRSEKLKATGIKNYGSEQAWRESLAKGGRKGGKAKVPKGYAVLGREAAVAGGKKSKRKYFT